MTPIRSLKHTPRITTPVQPKSSTGSSIALKVLMKDFKELQRSPLPNVSASPLESNMLEWHVNLRALVDSPYAGALFHLVIIFPEEYPNKPPSVTICTEFPHPHVRNYTLRVRSTLC